MSQQNQTQNSGKAPSQTQSAEVPKAQGAYGNSQDEQDRSEQDEADDPQSAKTIPGETSRDPAQQARADANPQLYEG